MRAITETVLAFDLHEFSDWKIQFPDGHTFGGGMIYFRYQNFVCFRFYFPGIKFLAMLEN